MRRGELAAQAPIGRSRAKNSSASHWLSAFAQNISWTRLVVRPFGTFSAKQRISSLLFMLKSNKNPGPLLNGSRTPTGGPRGTMFPLDIPSPRAHSGSIKCLSGIACSPSFGQAILNFSTLCRLQINLPVILEIPFEI